MGVDSMQNGRVLYFDPNNVNFNGSGDNLSSIFSGDEKINIPEDYTIAVDLEVISKSRNNVTSNDGKMVYSLTKSQPISNFLQGSKMGGENVLSTYFTDITYDNEQSTYQNEAMSINSVDIEFNSWYVASVVIKFTDVRGSSLFSPSEHMERNGTSTDTSNGNMFSGFFTMPYPIFNLKVKGFYGESVNYPLHLEDFKADFNAEMGNFDITARFIGYTYAMLSDIQMVYLISAPYLDTYGAAYWDSQVNNGRFTTFEGTPLLKIPELLKRIKKGEYIKSQIEGSSDTAKSAAIAESKINTLTAILDDIHNYINAIRQNYNVSGSIESGFNIEIIEKSGYKVITPTFKYDTNVHPRLKNLSLDINKYINKYPDDGLFEKYKGDNAIEYFKAKTKTIEGGTTAKLDVSEIVNKIETYIESGNNEIKNLSEEIASTVSNTLVETYQMSPNIYNFYKIIFAHMETLLHSIAACANNISNNEKRGFASGLEGTDFTDNKLLPFPWFTYDNKDEWIGNYHPDFSEVKLVKSFIKARNEISSELEKITTESPTANIAEQEVTLSVGDVWLPINSFDNSINFIGGKNSHPYSEIIKSNNSNINELKTLLSTRIATIIGLSSTKDKNMLNSYVIAESTNIIKQLGNTPGHIEDVINALNIIKKGSNTQDDYTCLTKYIIDKKIYYRYRLLNTEGILPLSDYTMNELKKSIKNGKIVYDINYYRNDTKTIKIGEKYKPKNVNIISGYVNCDYLYKNWFTPIETMVSSKTNDTNLTLLLSNVKMDKNHSAESFSTANHSRQPLMNRVCYVKPEFIKGSNDSTILPLYTACGYRRQNGHEADISETQTTKTIDPFIFSRTNPNYGNLYKLYLGKNNVGDVSNATIDLLDSRTMFINNAPDIANLTYPLIGGQMTVTIERASEVTSDICLFGCAFYYAQNNFTIGVNKHKTNEKNKAIEKARRAKSFLFLQTLPINVTSRLGSLLENERSFMIRVPKAELLLLGSMLWRRKNDIGNRPDKYKYSMVSSNVIRSDKRIRIPDTSRYFRQNGVFKLSTHGGNDSYDKCDVISKIKMDSHIDRELIKLFEKWSDSNEIDGWLKIQDNLELYGPNYQLLSQSKFKEFTHSFVDNPNVSFIRKQLHPNAIKNYTIIEPIDRRSVGLINRDKSPGVSAIINLLFDECILSYTGDGLLIPTKNEEGLVVDNTILDGNKVEYLIDGLLNKMNEHLKTLNSTEPTNPDQPSESSDSVAVANNDVIELQVYKYLKILYDKWISGYEFNTDNSAYKWIDTKRVKMNGFMTYPIRNFKFVDRSYHDIGDKFIIDYNDVLTNMVGLTEHRTLYSTVTDILSANNFLFIPMPNYQSWNTISDFSKVFKPISYVDSNMTENDDSSKLTSVFICMYTGEPSKKLNISKPEYDYKDDVLHLNVQELLPSDFSSVNDLEITEDEVMSMVPAFAVSYGKQNQSYFKSITLNQNNPATTDASIGVLRNLLSKNDNDSAVTTLSQNLFSLYSQFSYTCQVEMMGCAQIQPMMYFQLTNIPMWNGAYLIFNVKHSIKPGYMSTNFTGMRMSNIYPKLVTPEIVSSDNINAISHTITPEMDKVSTLSFDTKIGKYFTLGQYAINEGSVPEYIVSRLKNNVAPVIDSIYDSWSVSELNKNYGKFKITSGYRNLIRNREEVGSTDDSQHVQGLAVDIQLVAPSKVGNDALFEHIKQRMRTGLKMDQLINEPSKLGGWCHVSPVNVNGGNVRVRGMALVFDSNYKTIKSKSEIIQQAQGTSKVISPTSINNKFIEYWKSAENNKNYKFSGWDKEKNLWFRHASPEGGDPTIAYGIKLTKGYLQSDEMKLMDLDKLKNGTIGITDQTAINEIIIRANMAIKDIAKIINKRHGSGSFEKINEKYKYALVDIYLNTGGGNFKKDRWKPFIQYAVNNDLQGMLNNSDRVSPQRTKLFREYLQS